MAATIYDVADHARVSIATVSRVFNDHPRVSEATRRRVFGAAERMGYEPHASAQNLARKHTQTVAVVASMAASPVLMEVLRGVQDRLDESAYGLLVCAGRTAGGVDGSLARAVQRGRADGLLLVSTPMTPGRARHLAARRRAVVLLDGHHDAFDSVASDDRWGTAEAVRHLFARGHERIGLALPAPDLGRAHRAGYEDAHAAAGRPVAEALVVEADRDPGDHGATAFAGYHAVQTLLARFDAADRPTAVCVASDAMALGALRAARERGLAVPGDLDVIGSGDSEAAAYVGLTTLHLPRVAMGQMAAELLLRRLAVPDRPPAQVVFAPQLIVRETTGGTAAAPRSLSPTSLP